MDMKQLEDKMLCSPFLMFTNSHPEFGEELSDEEVATALDGIGLKYMFVSAVNAAGRPMNYFLVPTLGVTETEHYDLDTLIENILQQRYVVKCSNALTYMVLDLESTKIIATTSRLDLLTELPENDYYVTPMGQAFNFPFRMIELSLKGKT